MYETSLAEAWTGYEEALRFDGVYPASPETRRAFYAGAAATLAMVLDTLPKSDARSGAFVALVKLMSRELEQFAAGITVRVQ